ncbi:hypothetical protein EFD55_05465 [Rhizobium pisi]|uniref:Uncharacterized protein n=1 Tax=Rhizobium pisi TaxID=574561 RepID=A0A427N5P3_9HYPH|nr:hypothetical protein EFD55_05465 [Rhizobium pisi]TCA57680.1 hypothetical protein E0J16_12690 [Rhizobium pisi]
MALSPRGEYAGKANNFGEGVQRSICLNAADAYRGDRIPSLDGRRKLRHASYKGLREVQDNVDLVSVAIRFCVLHHSRRRRAVAGFL